MRSRKYSQPNLGVLIKYGMPFILTNGISTVFQGIDKFSLNYFCSYEEVGVYSSAMSLVNIFGIVQSSFNALWAPMATEHFEKNRDDKTFYQKGNAYITILMFLLGICLIFFKNILVILLGEKYREAASILPCLCFYPIMYTISETTVSGINFANKSYLHILVVLGACIINVIGNLLLVPILGGRGAAIATGASYIVFFVLRTYFANKCFPVNFKLKRFRILVCVTFVYALYNTFSEFNVIEVLMFFIVLFILYVLYRKEIAEGLTIIIKQISIQFKKKVVGGNE
jgi:O-antigen/teichoic acid export membrane protein